MQGEYLSRIFGEDVAQTPTELRLQKTALPMTASAHNSGEQIFAAIIKRSKGVFTPKRFEDDPDLNITIEDGLTGLVKRKEGDREVDYRRYQVVISFYERDEQLVNGINPDLY